MENQENTKDVKGSGEGTIVINTEKPVIPLGIDHELADILLMRAEKYRRVRPMRAKAVQIESRGIQVLGEDGELGPIFIEGSYLVEDDKGRRTLMTKEDFDDQFKKMKRQKKV